MQGGGVFAFRKFARLSQRLGQIRLQIRRQFFEVIRGGGVIGQEQFKRQIIGRPIINGGEVQNARHQNQAVEIHAVA